MAFKFNPFTSTFDIDNDSGGTSTPQIPQYDTDPVSPSPEDVWVRRSGSSTGGGELKYIFGLGMPITSSGTGSFVYELSYRTAEGTTKRVELT